MKVTRRWKSGVSDSQQHPVPFKPLTKFLYENAFNLFITFLQKLFCNLELLIFTSQKSQIVKVSIKFLKTALDTENQGLLRNTCKVSCVEFTLSLQASVALHSSVLAIYTMYTILGIKTQNFLSSIIKQLYKLYRCKSGILLFACRFT